MNILITGASRGIGFYTAIALASNSNNHVFAVSRDGKGLTSLYDYFLENKLPGRLTIYIGDTGSEDFLNLLTENLKKELSTLEVLINNAGYLKNAPFEELTISDWRKVYEANVFGPVNLIRTLLPLLKKGESIAGSGFRSHIVNIGSIGGVQGSSKFKGLSAYSSSKGALSVLTECLAEEFKEDHIAVNCLALGSVQTEMFSEAFPGFAAAKQPEEMGNYIGKFAMEGSMFFNGKVLEVSVSTP